jgi:hypothetical protein
VVGRKDRRRAPRSSRSPTTPLHRFRAAARVIVIITKTPNNSGRQIRARRRRGINALIMMRVFRTCPFANSRLLGGWPRINSTISWRAEFPAGRKNAGNFADQPLFAKICLENVCKFSRLRQESLRRVAGNYFARAGKQFGLLDRNKEFGAKSIRAPDLSLFVKAHPHRG